MFEHDNFMLRAISIAQQGQMTVHPNPVVGCVIVRDGQIIAEGWHQQAGKSHAEINAITQAKANNIDLKGATVYVTLEPCAHHGRTGPCCEALALEKVATVVVAMRDPNPQVQGKGLAYLSSKGIDVIVDVQKQAAREINRGFIKRMETGLPFVQLKLAASLDGRTAMANGESQWITDAAAREDVQQCRARVGAIITGSGTFYGDNPALNVRPSTWSYSIYPTGTSVRQPLRVIVATKTPTEAAKKQQIFLDDLATLWASPQASTYTKYPENIHALDVLRDDKGVDLKDLLSKLSRDKEINHVWVEAGAKLSAAFVDAGLVDELIMYYAPCLMGSTARPLFDMSFEHMSERQHLAIKSVRHVGETVRMVAHLV